MVLCITLKQNGKLSGNFVWLDMGLPSTDKESNNFNASVFTKFGCLFSGYLQSFVPTSGSAKRFWLKKLFVLVGKELTGRKLDVHFLLNYSTKTFSIKWFDPQLNELKFI